MAERTKLLCLPYILPAQAQKHVTHNAGLDHLDGIVHLSVLGAQSTTPPDTANDGDRYLIGQNASPPWEDHANDIAVRDGAEWRYLQPQTGWRCWDASTETLLVFTDAGWAPLLPDFPETTALLGINTNADATNRFTVASDGTLLTHAGTSHRMTINKAGMSDTASAVFQTNWSARAEIGLCGSDNFTIKTSADGAVFQEAISINASTARVSFPNGGGGPKVAQTRNTDTTTNLNTVSYQAVPLFGVSDICDPGFTMSADGVVCASAGRVKLYTNLCLNAPLSTVAMSIRFACNGVSLGGAASAVLTPNSPYTSVSLQTIYEVQAGDIITVEAVSEAGAADVTMRDGASILIVEQF